MRRCRRQAELVAELQRQHGEADADDELAEELRAGAQAEAALVADLDEVVEEADDAEADHQEQQQHAGRVRAAAAVDRDRQVGRGVAGDRRPDDRDAAHRRRAALDQVALRAVHPDLLAEAAAAEVGDDERGEQDRGDQADDGGDQDGLDAHALPPSASRPYSARAAVTSSIPATASPTRSRPGRARCLDQHDVARAQLVAQHLGRGRGVRHPAGLAVPRAFQSGAVEDRPGRLTHGDHPCYRSAGGDAGRAPRARHARPAPSSAIWPEHRDRPGAARGPAIVTSASSAARIDSGLAL